MIATVALRSAPIQRAQKCRIRIAELIEDSAISVGGGVYAWGQFLDSARQTNQIGIYGTSAAIEVLASSGYSQNNQLIRNAILALPGITAGTVSGIYDNDDLGLAFKAAAILEAAQPGQSEFQVTEPVETLLLDRIVDASGWGHYHLSTTVRDHVPRLLPTTVVLYALRRSRDFANSLACEKVIAWLCQRILADAGLLPEEVAMAVLVFSCYENTKPRVGQFSMASDAAAAWLISWASTRTKAMIGEGASYHYTVQTSAGQQNHYVFYPVDLLAAVALIRAGNPMKSRSYVLRVARYTCMNVENNRGYRARATNRIATVDQVWATRLLGEVAGHDSKDLLPRMWYVASRTRTRRFLIAIVLLAVAILFAALPFDASTSAAVKALEGAISALAIGILATALWAWWAGD